MKYLDAKGENKMRDGTRTDEQSAESVERVQKLADELKVDLSKVAGTGRRGAVTENDVRRAANQITPPISGIRRAANKDVNVKTDVKPSTDDKE